MADKELIERLAREAGFAMEVIDGSPEPVVDYFYVGDMLRRFAALVAQECAKVCDFAPAFGSSAIYDNAAHDCAKAIRAKFKEQ